MYVNKRIPISSQGPSCVQSRSISEISVSIMPPSDQQRSFDQQSLKRKRDSSSSDDKSSSHSECSAAGTSVESEDDLTLAKRLKILKNREWRKEESDIPSSKEQTRLSSHDSMGSKDHRRQKDGSSTSKWRRSTSIGSPSNPSCSTGSRSSSSLAKLPYDPATMRKMEQFPHVLSDATMPDEDPALKSLALNALDLTAPASDVILKNRLKSWFQLSGHPDVFAPAGPGTVWKKRTGDVENTERLVYETLSKEGALRDCIPRYYREVEYRGDTFIELQDLLFGFNDPHVMDIKMGTRTFLESEVSKTTARQDLYQKMIAVDPDAPTQVEREQRAVTKLRYMLFREQQSSTCSHGFRIEAMKLPGAPPITDLKKVKSHSDVLDTIRQFLGRREDTRQKILARLRDLRNKIEESKYFETHEIIGSSIFMIYDSEKVGIWLIDFAKTREVPDGRKLTHRLPWQEGNHEEGFLFGLDKLLSTIEEVRLST